MKNVCTINRFIDRIYAFLHLTPHFLLSTLIEPFREEVNWKMLGTFLNQYHVSS